MSGNGYTPRQRDDAFYGLLAGGAKTRLLESMLDLELPALLADYRPLSADEIADRLALHRHRAAKWLHLLARVGLLEETAPPDEDAGARRYSLSALTRAMFDRDGRGGWLYRDMVRYWQAVARLDFLEVLRGMPMPAAVRWPPRSIEAAEHLSTWMRVSAHGPLHALENALDLDSVGSMLDVGGNDATIACNLARKHPSLEVTVFDLPEAAFLARKNIAAEGLGERVRVREGNFLTDPLPEGFDMVLFSRTLTDWPPDVCRDLLAKARRSLRAGGRVVICEALLDSNEDYALAWEFRYVFYDDFGVGVFKPAAVYQRILADLGYGRQTLHDRDDETFYSVLVAERD